MVKYITILLLILCFYNDANAQVGQILPRQSSNTNYVTYQNNNYIQQEQAQTDEKQNIEDEAKSIMRRKPRNSANTKEARNLLIVKQVADFKYGDEKLAGNFEELENEKTFQNNLNKIMSNLENKKMRNSKNREVISILNEAGNKLYNLLAN